MRPGKLFIIHVVFWASSAFALPVQAETPDEETVQYALEYLPSGVSTVALIQGTEITVMPLRTWKSVSGHYCRQYEITVTEPRFRADRGKWIRCRDSDGIWKQVTED